jgi:hypothetical protein
MQSNPGSSAPTHSEGASERYKRNLSALRFAQLLSLGRDATACDAATRQLVNQANNFDDFSFWIRLPLPINAISPGTVAFLENSGNSVQDRIAVFAQSLYRQWVEEQDQLRCRLFFECLLLADKVAKFAEITGGLSAQTPTASTQTFKACAGEFDAGCAAGAIRFDCDHANDEADATQICETQRGAFRHTLARIDSHGGNRCGYWDDLVTCYFAPAVKFP